MNYLRIFLRVLCAFSIGFSFPVYASQTKTRGPANEAAPDEVAEAIRKFENHLRKANLQTVKIYDAQGGPTTFERVWQNERSFSEGLIFEHGGLRVRMRGELLDEGKNGMLLMATQEVDGRPVNGQVMTIKPGMTKLEIENRIQDLAYSFSMNFAAMAKKGDRAPAKAIENPLQFCLTHLAITMIAGGLVQYRWRKMSPALKAQFRVFYIVAIASSVAAGTLAGSECVRAMK